MIITVEGKRYKASAMEIENNCGGKQKNIFHDLLKLWKKTKYTILEEE